MLTFNSIPTKRLTTTLDASALTLTVDDIKGWDGVDLVAGDFGDRLFAVLRDDANTKLELIELDESTIADASITILKRGLKFTGDLSTEVTANKLLWPKNSTLVELGSNPPQLLNHMVQIIGAQTIAGVKTFSSAAATSAGDPVLDNDFARKAYVDSVGSGGTITNQAVVVAGNAGETVAAGEGVYFDETDNEWKLWDASVTATTDKILLGIAQGAGTNGNAITGGVLLLGLDENQTGLTIGDKQFISDTPGALATSAGTIERAVGIARSATTFYFDPYMSSDITKAERDSITNANPVGSILMYGAAAAPAGYLLCDGAAVSRTTFADLFSAISTTYGIGDGSTTFNTPNFKSSIPIGLGQRVETFTFEDGDVNTGNEQITIDSNDYLHTGQKIALTTDGVLPTGLSATDYYVIKISATVVQLGSTLANAIAGTAVDITAAAGGGTHTMTLTLTNRSLADEGGEENHALVTDEIPAHTHDTLNNITSDAADAIQGGSLIGSSRTSTSNATGGSTAHNNLPPYVVVNHIIKT